MTHLESARRTRLTRGLAVVAAAILVSTSCADDGSGSDTTRAGGADVTVENVWARTSPMSATVGAVYMDISVSSDDELVGVAVDPGIAAAAEMHETLSAHMSGSSEEDPGMTGDSMTDGGSGGMPGEMTMQPVSSIAISQGAVLSLAPGGYHIMLLDLAKPLEIGATFDLSLEFARAGSVVVSVEVRDEAP